MGPLVRLNTTFNPSIIELPISILSGKRHKGVAA